jgi:hypothetical protein
VADDNLRHWSALEKTDPTHTKPFNRGRFKGTATKPIYHEQRLTEHFGPCGIGWGMGKPEFSLVPALDEVVVFCSVMLWYQDGKNRGEVWGVGGDKVLAQQSTGPFINDESYKSAFTDALGNAMKHLGVGADVHMGRFDDHKYVREMREEFAAEPEARPQAPQKPAEAPQYPRTPNGGPPSMPPQTRSVGSESQQLTMSQIRDEILAALPLKNTRLLVDAFEKLREPDLAMFEEKHPPTGLMLRQAFEAQRQRVESGL